MEKIKSSFVVNNFRGKKDESLVSANVTIFDM